MSGLQAALTPLLQLIPFMFVVGDRHLGNLDGGLLEAIEKPFPVVRMNARAKTDVFYASIRSNEDASKRCEQPPLTLVYPIGFLVRQDLDRRSMCVECLIFVNEGRVVIVRHPNQMNIVSQALNKVAGAIADANACVVAGVMSPHELAIKGIAEAADADAVLAVND